MTGPKAPVEVRLDALEAAVGAAIGAVADLARAFAMEAEESSTKAALDQIAANADALARQVAQGSKP